MCNFNIFFDYHYDFIINKILFQPLQLLTRIQSIIIIYKYLCWLCLNILLLRLFSLLILVLLILCYGFSFNCIICNNILNLRKCNFLLFNWLLNIYLCINYFVWFSNFCINSFRGRNFNCIIWNISNFF